MSWFYKLMCKCFDYIVIPNNGEPYLTRWFLNGKPKYEDGEAGKVYMHFFHTSDRDRALHNHPWTGTSLILKGGYSEERRHVTGVLTAFNEKTGKLETNNLYSESEFKVCKPGSINKIGLNDFHCAKLLNEDKGAWTLFFTGPRVKDWGFLTRETNTFTPWREFLNETGEKSYRDDV